MKKVTIRNTTVLSICSAALALVALLAVFAAEARAVTIAWSPVGNPGNAADPADGDSTTAGIQNFGAVPYAYNIGTYDVTASQYVEFLNTKDPSGTNPLGLYDPHMADNFTSNISFTNGNADGSKYSVVASHGNHPANSISWYNAIRFANWLNNGQGSGDTETGAYTLGALGAGGIPVTPPLTHNAGSKVWLPTEDEWYKAAYYNPGTNSYFQYPTSSDTPPTATGPTATPNSANYNFVVHDLTDVGAYSGTTSPSGAFDMAGNVWQWNEALFENLSRGQRGGSFSLGNPSSKLLSSNRSSGVPTGNGNLLGFRVASVASIPEPSAGVLAIFACGMVLGWWNRKRRLNATLQESL